MAFKWPDKDPEEILDYPLDWVDWLITGRALDDSTVVQDGTSTPGGLSDITIMGASTYTTTQSIVWLSGGTIGETYTFKITVSDDEAGQDRTGVRRVKIKVKQK